ncbi:MAG: mannonate dehydratase [Niabella sp.]
MNNQIGMTYSMRWFGPKDPVNLLHIKQAGCTAVVTALHQIPAGEVWSVEAIMERKQMIVAEGLSWEVVESLPVHEDIKKKTGQYASYIENYIQSLKNLAACGIKVVAYNFMPLFDWMRTDVNYRLSDGTIALYYERSAFIAFDVWMLQRPGAANDYTDEELAAARKKYNGFTDIQKQTLFKNVLLSLPGTDNSFTAEGVLAALETYAAIDEATLRVHLFYFLQQIIPEAEACGIKMAIHPDDPPFSILGLPRIVKTEADATAIVNAVPSEANGLCFCTGSYGVRADNDLPGMVKRLAKHIHFLHLRSTQRDDAGNFYEANHLTGDVDMYAVIKEALEHMQQNNISIPMRPDHGHLMLDDMNKTFYPGYSLIGRLKSMAELRGLETGIKRILRDNN